ncbi:CD209 antigen-like protein C isoform X2 [Fukomys damarensis]|uniref:CD209 antigen-like protein C isoform X2 n=1 Tax=Fukomys damarensis TaxID=885580 RepID=UPI00053FD19F|nr:CD209 antigen-like protein C isoform X2 [Fukomys damarensis]
MRDAEEARTQPLGPQGRLGRGSVAPVLQLLSLALFTVVLVVILVKVSKVPSYQERRQEKQKIDKEMSQLKTGIAGLCRPCPWDWTLFQRNCYFFSQSKRNWADSVIACQDMGAQLVVIKSVEEQNFLQLNAKNKGPTWMGLSDLKKEGVWQWVDGSHLWFSLSNNWLPGEPNNDGDEDCAEFRGDGWNDGKCRVEKFWICKEPAASCSSP